MAAFLFVLAIASAAPRNVPDEVLAVLRGADEIEFYSLEPEPSDEQIKQGKDSAFRGGWIVLGKTTLKDGKARKQLLDALEDAITNGAKRARCFRPRYAVRAAHKGGRADVVICFECGHVYIYLDDKSDEPAFRLSVSLLAQPTFEAILKAAGVPLSKPKKE
jgi:hypothetical protein